MSGIRYGHLTRQTAHLCIDMQNLLGADSPWHTPWAMRVLPAVYRLCEVHPGATIFTRFIPPTDLDALPGMWRRYYHRWRELTPGRVDPHLLDLLPPLAALAPPATVLDKPVYSPFSGHRLIDLLQARGIDTLVVSGAETDVCVLATVLGAIDRGYRVVVASDALCGSHDQTHDGALTFYRERLRHQVEAAPVDEIIDAWR